MPYFIEVLRPRQWYKNLVIVLVLIFANQWTNYSLLKITLGFLSLCLLSSTNYILNDIHDRKKDLIHPEKATRPIASGKISVPVAGFLACGTATIAFLISSLLPWSFSIVLLAIFLLTQIYTFFLKNEVFLDIIIIATNFVLRAISGVAILDVRLSPWLILCTFFLSLFLITAKRIGDLEFLKESAQQHKPVLRHYTKNISQLLLIITSTALIISYSLYSFLSIYPFMIYTLPIAIYIILRYLSLFENNSFITRHPEYFYKDTRLLTGIISWLIIAMIIVQL